jgi:hypothetical protein
LSSSTNTTAPPAPATAAARAGETRSPDGHDHFRLGLSLAAAAWLAFALLECALFWRPTPYGAAYVSHWDRYLFHALFYDLLGVALLSAPFLVVWLALWRRPLVRRRWRALHGTQIALLSLSILFTQADHEAMRFMGVHLTRTFLTTYGGGLSGSLDTIWQSILSDAGGPGLPFAVLFVALGGFLFLAVRRLRRPPAPAGRRRLPLAAAIALVVVPLAGPLIAKATPGGQFRILRVQPWLLTIYDEWRAGKSRGEPPADLERLVARYQERWLAESADPGWTFPDPERPFLRVPQPGHAPAPDDGGPWNVIVLQLESLRTVDTGLLGDSDRPSATPFLDALARSPEGAWWPRHVSFGPPTVSGFFGSHCSITPHSREHLTTHFTFVDFFCLPQLLRAKGYQAEYFTGSDPDWDSQRIWLLRWYDQHWFYRDADEADRIVFRRAAERIREIGREGRPFLATIVSISNHFPYKTREPELDLAGQDDVRDRVRNTTHYTDDVVRELVDSLRAEAFFARTVFVIFGDHGYNLGEHDGTPGQRTVHTEAVRVPLVVWGPHPRLPRGRQDAVASLLDLAPTVADLVGAREPNPWQGHSLLAGPRNATFACTSGPLAFAESPRFSLVTDGETGAARLYDAVADPLQTHDLAVAHPDEVAALRERVREHTALGEYVIEAGRVWTAPAPEPAPTPAVADRAH